MCNRLDILSFAALTRETNCRLLPCGLALTQWGMVQAATFTIIDVPGARTTQFRY